MSEGVNKDLSGKDVIDDKKELDNTENLDNLGVNDAGVIPKGTIDPVYEAKARVLNHAVCVPTIIGVRLTNFRSKRLEWDGTNGNCSLW
jgi:hypothetical protein